MNPIGTAIRRFDRRDGALIVDTGLSAVMGLLLVVIGARNLTGQEFDHFSTTQLVIVALVGVLRSGIYGPAMHAQKVTGKAVIPLTWMLIISLPLAVGSGVVFGPMLAPSSQNWPQWTICLVLTMASVLLQDAGRSMLLSRDLVVGALLSDGIGLATLMVEAASGRLGHSGVGQLYAWAIAAGCGLVASLTCLVIWRTHSAHIQRQSLAATWRLGRWSGLDAVLSNVGALFPFFIATLVIGDGTSGVYRTLQTALGPLNIIHTTVMTSFGLDAWQASTSAGLAGLGRKVNRLTAGMFGFSIVYVALGLPAIIWVARLDHPQLLRVSLIVALGAVMGATTTGWNAGALVLGYQWAGAVIRGVLVVCSIAISLPWSVRHWVPWNDPIGTTWLMSSAVALVGWSWAFARATRAETVNRSFIQGSDLI